MWYRLLGLSVVIVVVGCVGPSLENLDDPDELTVYSIDGRDEPRDNEPAKPGTFHRYPIFGEVTVTDPEVRREIIRTFKEDHASRPDDGLAKCFIPRHGLRVVQGGWAVEYVICYQCWRFEEYRSGQFARHQAIGHSASRAAMNKVLTDAKVPLCPER